MVLNRPSVRIGRERGPLGQAVVENTTQRIQIRPLIQRLQFDLFRSDVVDGTEKRSSLIKRLFGGSLGEFGETKIEELDVEPPAGQPGQHDVLGLDVAVQQIHLLGSNERIERLHHEIVEIL